MDFFIFKNENFQFIYDFDWIYIWFKNEQFYYSDYFILK